MRNNTSSNSIISPYGRTLTRTQDFMVVPSEVVYGPGGEKINRGIAYTALDGRMNSSFRIPVNSSYQEEAEARRMKREKAMMKSKMMRPAIPSDKWSLVDCSRRSPAVNSARDLDGRSGSRARSSSVQNPSGFNGPPMLKSRRKKEPGSNSGSRGGSNRNSQRSVGKDISPRDSSISLELDRTPSDKSLRSNVLSSSQSGHSYGDGNGQSRTDGEGSQHNSGSKSSSVIIMDGESSQLNSRSGSKSTSRRNSTNSLDSMGIQIVKTKDDIDSDEERGGGPRSLLLPGETFPSSVPSPVWNIHTVNDITGRSMEMGVVIDTSISHDMPLVSLGEIKRAQVRFHGDPGSSDMKMTRPVSSLSIMSGISSSLSANISSDEIVGAGEELESLASSLVSSLGEQTPRSRSLSPHTWPFQKNKSFIIVRTNSQSMMNLGPLDNVNEWEEDETNSPPLESPAGEKIESNKSAYSKGSGDSGRGRDQEEYSTRRKAFTTRDKTIEYDYDNEEEMEGIDLYMKLLIC
jgi:hypothetical protein